MQNNNLKSFLGRRKMITSILAGAGIAALAPILQSCAPTAAPSPTTAPAATKPAEVPAAAKSTEAPKAAATTAPVGPSSPTTAATAAKPTEAAKPASTTATTSAKDSSVLGKVNAPDVRKYSGQTINLAVQQHTATDAIRSLTPGFEEQTGIKVAFEQIPQQQMNQKQMTDMSTSTGAYDVIGWFLNPEYIENGWIWSVEDLKKEAAGATDEKLLAIDDFFPKFLSYYRYKDKLYGLPFYGESLMMYYNTEEFKKAGIDKAPDTVEDLEAACKKIKDGGRMSGIALRGSQEGNAAIYPFLAWIYGYGGFWVNQDTFEVGLNKPESIEAAQAWGHFMRDYGPKDVAGYYWNEVQLSIQQEKAAIIMDATNFGPRLEDPSQSKVANKVGYAPLPQVIGPAGPRGPKEAKGRFGHSTGTYALSVPKTSKKKEPAWLFTQWATSPDVMLKTTQLGLRGDPTRRSSLTNSQFIEKYNYGNGAWAKTLSETFDLAMPTYWPRVITGTELADILGLALSEILTGKKEAKQAFTEAHEKSVSVQKKAGLLK